MESFKNYAIQRENEDPVAAWNAMRAAAGFTPRPEAVNLPPAVTDILQKGFSDARGKVLVPRQLIDQLGLKVNGRNYSLVADGSMFTRGMSHPFWRPKGSMNDYDVYFTQGFRLPDLLRMLK